MPAKPPNATLKMKIDIKYILSLLSVIAILLGGAYRIDKNTEEQIDRALRPIEKNIDKMEKNIEKIRDMFEDFLLQTASKRERGGK